MAKTTAVQQSEKKTAFVGNRTTELIIGSAANKMLSASTSFESMLGAFDKMKNEFQETIDSKTLEVVTLESKIEDLKQDLLNKKTQNEIEIKNHYDATKKTFVENWLKENGYTMIYSNELAALKKDLADTKADVANQIKTAVTANTELLNNSHQNEISTLKLTHEKEEADNKAKIGLMNEKIVFLGEQVDSWKKALNDEREAGVKRAQASQIQNLNVGNGGK